MTQYTRHPPLLESALDRDPLVQLERWLADARAAQMIEPTAMTLATVDADGKPSARVVLYKGEHEGGLCFYTNYGSRKGAALAAHPSAALVFWWDKLERQVRVEGRVEKLPRAMAEAYFRRRPRESQLGALTSRQSQVCASREELDRRYAENAKRFENGDVPLPEDWGGYRLVPEEFEFWQGQVGRLHDRLCYTRAAAGWKIRRLEP